MNVFVTGGAGYIGSHTVAELIDRNYKVIVYDNLTQGYRQSIPDDVLFVQGDLLNLADLRRAFSTSQPAAVLHFAAHCSVGESMTEPEKYYQNNVTASLNLLTVMREFKVNNIVFSSTAAVYGEPEQVPIREDSRINPTNTYGETKLAFERILHWYALAYGMKYVSLRYFNAAGAHIKAHIGEHHLPETHLIPLVLSVALGKLKAVKIFGTDYPTPDGTCIRDYIHITDLADAHILALEQLSQGKTGIYNLGNGNGFSVREIIRVAEKVTGKKIQTIETGRRPGDPAVLVASSDRIRKELNWHPQYADVETIIKTAWQWHSTHPEGYTK